jgi:hypothetical protein
VARKRQSDIPTWQQPGAVFAILLEDGRHGACRVLRRDKQGRVLVAGTPWIGTAPPDLDEPQLREILYLTHHSWQDHPDLVWINGPPPAEFTYLGHLPLSDEDAASACSASGGWGSPRIQALMQWRWDHEREAVLAEDAARAKKEANGRAASEVAYIPLPATSLAELRRETFFKRWNGYVDAANIRAARQLIRTAIDELLALGPDASESEKLDVLHACVEDFNDLNDEDEHFIETIEREHICDVLGKIAERVGLEDYHEHIARGRDW